MITISEFWVQYAAGTYTPDTRAWERKRRRELDEAIQLLEDVDLSEHLRWSDTRQRRLLAATVAARAEVEVNVGR